MLQFERSCSSIFELASMLLRIDFFKRLGQTKLDVVKDRLQRWPPFAKGSLSGSWDRICGSSGLRRPLPRLSGKRHISWRSAS